MVPPKVVEMNDLSNPVTSNSVPTTKDSTVVENDKVIAPEMFRINPFRTSREDKFEPINKVRASVRTNPITPSQPHVITKKDVNSNSNGLSSTGVDNTAKTKRPQSRSNTKNDRVPSVSKSSCIKNKEVEVEEHLRNLLLLKNKKHMSSECNNIKLAIRNDKSEVVCAMYTSNLLTKLDRTKEKLENCIIKKEKEYAIKRLQAQLGDFKGKSQDTPCVSDTLDPLSQKLEDENVSLEFQLFDKVSKQKDTTKGMSANTKFTKKSILGKPPSSSKLKLYSVNTFPNSKVIPKVGETNALLKPVTSHSVPDTQESKVTNNTKVNARVMFRINPTMNSRVENFVPNKHVKQALGQNRSLFHNLMSSIRNM
ncbi:hypothetical protein Tco_1148890 [Tanacetum coccineum]